jgi:predicted nucleotidyltransferase
MNRYELVAYAMDFCSFLMKSRIAKKINRIILFGSVARGDFDRESDVDLFIDCRERIEKEVKKVLKRFELSEVKEKWRLKDITNPISLKVGDLEKWRLRRSIISSGIILYGKYKEMPRDVKYYFLFNLDFRGMERKRKIKIWRELYGYKQRVGEKEYTSKGFLYKVGGKKLEKSMIIVPAENKSKIMGFLKKYKIRYKMSEIWSDVL